MVRINCCFFYQQFEHCEQRARSEGKHENYEPEGAWPNSLVVRTPWLYASSVKNKTNCFSLYQQFEHCERRARSEGKHENYEQHESRRRGRKKKLWEVLVTLRNF